MRVDCDGCGKSNEKASLQVLDHKKPCIRSYCKDCASAIRSLAYSVFVPVNETDSY